MIKEAKKALAKRDLKRAFKGDFRPPVDGVRMFVVNNSQRIPVQLGRTVPGAWDITLEWVFQPVPLVKEYLLLQSSFGLNVSGLSQPAAPEKVCFVRYDVDNDRSGPGLTTLGRHLNVWQPGDLEDKVHFPCLDSKTDAWSVDEVLEVFLSVEFASDLLDRIS